MPHFDAIVVGVGGMGSASAYHLAKRGIKVLALEQYQLNHKLGSSHGKTRVTRTCYAEGTSYVPLVKRATELFFELERESGMRTITLNGGLMIGTEDSKLVSGALKSTKAYTLAHEMLSASEVSKRFPAFVPSPEEVALFDPAAGVIFPENCIEAHVRLAMKLGAEVRFEEEVTGWESRNGQVRVDTKDHEYTAGKLVFCSGSWLPQLVPSLSGVFGCERAVLFWVPPRERPDIFKPDSMPVFLWEDKKGVERYGIPDFGDGVKLAVYRGGEMTSPAKVRREVDEKDRSSVRDFFRRRIPLLSENETSTATCFYTDTPDSDFVIDFLPSDENVIIVSPCSGHGFKFTSAVGEVVSQLVANGRSRLDISSFTIRRFGDAIR